MKKQQYYKWSSNTSIWIAGFNKHSMEYPAGWNVSWKITCEMGSMWNSSIGTGLAVVHSIDRTNKLISKFVAFPWLLFYLKRYSLLFFALRFTKIYGHNITWYVAII